jgi:HlyD family secretion protein
MIDRRIFYPGLRRVGLAGGGNSNAVVTVVTQDGQQWLSFNVREEYLSGLAIGKTVGVMKHGDGGAIKSAVTELRPLGDFATWQAERVIGDHDRNTLRLRLDPERQTAGLEPGMTVWIGR